MLLCVRPEAQILSRAYDSEFQLTRTRVSRPFQATRAKFFVPGDLPLDRKKNLTPGLLFGFRTLSTGAPACGRSLHCPNLGIQLQNRLKGRSGDGQHLFLRNEITISVTVIPLHYGTEDFLHISRQGSFYLPLLSARSFRGG